MLHRSTFRPGFARPVTNLVCLLIAAALLAGACGGGGDDTSGDASSDTAQAAGGSPSKSDDDPGGSTGGGNSTGGQGDAAMTDWASDQANVITPEPGKITFEVTFSDDTVVVSADAVREVSGDHTYVLDAEAAVDLEPGSVLLIPGTALRRVTGVEGSGGQVRVTTAFAALTDAIDDGDIRWDVALPAGGTFQTDPDSTPLPSFDEVAAPPAELATIEPIGVGVTMPDGTTQQVAWVVTQDEQLPLRWTYKDGPLEYLFALGVADEHLDVQVQVKRDVGGRTALTFTATGRIETPRSSGNVQIRDGELRAATIDQKGLHGRLELDIAAAGGGKVPIDFELPGIWFKYVVPVGPIPVTIGMNARVIGDIEVPAEASALAHASYTFGGDMGFRLEGGSVAASVNMPDLGLVPEPADSAAMIGNFVNAEFGLAFPQTSISLFDQGVIPSVYPGVILGTRLEWGPVCKTAYVKLVVQGRYDFKILGVNLLSGKRIDLIEPVERTARGESCPPE
jgi:hypothetical protein